MFLEYFPLRVFSLVRPNVSKSVELTFNFLDNAAHCPLPDSGPSSPDTTKDNPNFKYPITSSNVTQQYKSIQLDENHSFYLIRHTDNQAYIPCFHLARLLHLSESEILSDTVRKNIPRIVSSNAAFDSFSIVIIASSFHTNTGKYCCF